MIDWEEESGDLKEILDHLPKMIVCTFSSELVYKRAHGTLFFELGITPEEIIGKSVEDVLEYNRRGIVMPYFRMALEGNSVTFLHERNDVFLEVSIFPVRRMTEKGAGAVTGGITCSRDVSHRIRNIMMTGYEPHIGF